MPESHRKSKLWFTRLLQHLARKLIGSILRHTYMFTYLFRTHMVQGNKGNYGQEYTHRSRHLNQLTTLITQSVTTAVLTGCGFVSLKMHQIQERVERTRVRIRRPLRFWAKIRPITTTSAYRNIQPFGPGDFAPRLTIRIRYDIRILKCTWKLDNLLYENTCRT